MIATINLHKTEQPSTSQERVCKAEINDYWNACTRARNKVRIRAIILREIQSARPAKEKIPLRLMPLKNRVNPLKVIEAEVLVRHDHQSKWSSTNVPPRVCHCRSPCQVSICLYLINNKGLVSECFLIPAQGSRRLSVILTFVLGFNSIWHRSIETEMRSNPLQDDAAYFHCNSNKMTKNYFLISVSYLCYSNPFNYNLKKKSEKRFLDKNFMKD